MRMPKRVVVASVLVGCFSFFNSIDRVNASDWAGGSASWSSDSSPGWNSTGVPDAQGAVANNAANTTGTTTLDMSPTVGTLSFGGNANVAWTLTLTNPLNLDQDGAGGSPATISNSNTDTGATNGLILGAGTINLYDDLLISNTSASTRTGGAISISSILAGTPGSVTIESVGNAFPVSTTSYAGAIRLAGANTFTAPVTINKGVVTFTTNLNPFGDPSNTLTIGQAGAGLGATVVSTNTATVPQNIIITAGTGGTTILGSVTTSASGIYGYSGTVLLNGDLTVTGQSLSGIGTNFSNAISGVGALTKEEPVSVTAPGIVTLSGDNTYTGITSVKTGTLQFAKKTSLYNDQQGALAGYWNATNLVVESGAAASFYVGGTGEFSIADVQSLMGMSTATGGFKSGSLVGINTTNAAGGVLTYSDPITDVNAGANQLGLIKHGTNTLKLTGTNTYTGKTVVATGVLQFANQNAFYNNGTAAAWDATNLTVISGATAMFNIGGAGEFTLTDIQNISALGTATGGFLSGSLIGMDTTNAGAETVYSNVLANTNGGTNNLGLHKIGANTLTLSAANTYKGSTYVDGGTLKITGSHAGGTSGYRVGRGTGFEGTLIIDNAGTPPTITAGLMSIGDGTLTGGIGHGSQVNGSITLSDYFAVANNAGTTGDHTQSGGSLTTTSTSTSRGVIVGWWGNGTYTMDGGTMTSRSWVTVGYGDGLANAGTGLFTLNNGTILVNDDGTGGGAFGLGRASNGTGTLVMNNGSITVNNDWFVIGVSGTGTATMNNGTINTLVFAYAQNTGSTSTFNMNGGTVISTANMTSYSGTTTINQTGGELRIGTWFTLGENAVANSTYNLSGGTMSTGNVTGNNFVVSYRGNSTVNQTGGDVTCKNGGDLILGWVGGSTGNYNLSSGTIAANDQFFVGIDGTGVFTQTGGSISIASWSSIGRGGTGNGQYIMSGGTSTWNSDMNIGDYGTGSLDLSGGTLSANEVSLGWQSSGNGTALIHGASAVMNVNGAYGVFVGRNGTGSLEIQSGTINIPNISGDMRLGQEATGNGTVTQSGGSITSSDQTYVGISGIGLYMMSGGTYTGHDNCYIGLNGGSTGEVQQTGGTFTLVGDDPSFTGNLIVGQNGVGTYKMDGGTLSLAAVDLPDAYNTLNSASYSIANYVTDPLELAEDGNMFVGRLQGSGTFEQTAGTVNVAANVFVGAGDIPNDIGATGNFKITGGTFNVGTTSPTGGDFVLGALATSNATVSLEGGTLNVANGSGKIGAALGATIAFNFTGGTLKVKEFNAGDFGSSMGNLVQNGTGSLLDVTGNDTDVVSSYDLGAGTATIATGHTLTAFNVLNSAGAGVINVGSGPGAPLGDYNLNGIVDAADFVLWRKNPGLHGGDPTGYNVWRANYGATGSSPANLDVGSGTVSVDTLNLNDGVVTATGGVDIATKLAGNGSINGSVVAGAGAEVAPGLSAGELSITGDLTFNASSVLKIELGGATAGLFDKINLTGALAAAGTLQVSLINSYSPLAGTTFDILDFGSQSGSFTLAPPSGSWSYNASSGVLTFVAPGLGSGGSVPEPTAAVLISMAVAGLFGGYRGRRRAA